MFVATLKIADSHPCSWLPQASKTRCPRVQPDSGAFLFRSSTGTCRPGGGMPLKNTIRGRAIGASVESGLRKFQRAFRLTHVRS
jgi:hypothetical protein